MKPRTLVAAVALSLCSAGAWGQVYKWVDDKGRTHYGEKPPEGVKATEVGVPTGTAGGPAPSPPSMQSIKEREIELRRARLEREKRDDAGGKEAAAREQRCAAARRQLAGLQEQIRIYDRNDKGEKVYLEDKDRPAAIAGAQRRVDENCR